LRTQPNFPVGGGRSLSKRSPARPQEQIRNEEIAAGQDDFTWLLAQKNKSIFRLRTDGEGWASKHLGRMAPWAPKASPKKLKRADGKKQRRQSSGQARGPVVEGLLKDIVGARSCAEGSPPSSARSRKGSPWKTAMVLVATAHDAPKGPFWGVQGLVAKRLEDNSCASAEGLPTTLSTHWS